MEHKKVQDMKTAELRALRLAETYSDQLKRQIELKEMFEDKLRDTLDVNMGGTNKKGLEQQRQKQTKRILDGFNIEMQSLFMEREHQMHQKIKTSFDVTYG